MKWWKLRYNQCPKCETKKILSFEAQNGFLVCAEECGFFISNEKFSQIVMEKNARDVERKAMSLMRDGDDMGDFPLGVSRL